MPRKAASPALSKLEQLPLSKQVFVKAMTDPTSATFLNRKRSYKAAHPHVKDQTAEVNGYQTLRNTQVKEAVQAELEAQGVTKDWVKGKLVKYVHDAEKDANYLAGASIVMDLAKVEGYLIDKKEVTQVNDEKVTAIRRLVAEQLGQSSN